VIVGEASSPAKDAGAFGVPVLEWPPVGWNGMLSRDPWRIYGQLRRVAPVAYSPRLRAFFVFGFDEVAEGLASARLSAEEPFRTSTVMFGRTMLDTDGDTHARLRDVFAPALRPSRMPEYQEEIVQPLVTALVAESGLGRAGGVDVIEAIAARLPMQVLCRLLGIGDPAVDWLRVTVEPLADLIDHGRVDRRRARSRHQDLVRLAAELVADRKLSGPLGHAMQVAVAEGAIGEDDLVANLVLLFLGGTATTSAAIGNVVATVLRHQELGVEGELAVDRSDAADALELVREALRLQPPVRFAVRFARAPTRLGSAELVRGARIQLCVASANRDGAVYVEPDTWCPGRVAPASLTFGRGLHSCIGAFLGELEARCVLDAVRKLPPLRIEEPPRLRPGWTFRRLSSLRLSPA
jgi:cytochrome P450